MEMKRITLSVISTMALLLLAGCMTAPGGIAASTIPITSKDSYTVVRRNVEESDGCLFFLGIPLGPTPSIYSALQEAKRKNNADGLINVTSANRYRYTLFLFCWQEMSINGDAIKFKIGGDYIE